MVIKNVYIVEDDAFFAQSFIKKLEKLGDFKTHHFENVVDALKNCKDDEPEVVFLDHVLLASKGIDSIPTWKKILPNSEIIIITNKRDVDIITQAFDLGASDFFLKDNLLMERTEQYLDGIKGRPKGLKAFFKKLYSK